LALDESQENDLFFNDRDITYFINRDDFEKVKPIHIGFVETEKGSGFTIKSSLPGVTYRPALKV
jgi:Fe-S cluster assembly iron-binding protein IscA